MRIIFFNYEYPPLGGGAGNATAYILKEFSQIPDLELDLVTSAHDNKFSLEKIGEKIRIHKLPIGDKTQNLHFQSQKDLMVYAWKAFWYAQKLIRKEKYDLSHSFFTVPCGFLSLIFKWFFGVPYIISLRGADVPGYSDRFPMIYFLLTPIIKLIWSGASSVISNSQGLKELALKTNPKQKIDTIFNGIDVSEFKPAEKISENFQIICVSRLTQRKGLHFLISAFAKIISEFPNVQLKIVGEGDAQEKLEFQTKELGLKEKINFTGRIEHEKLPSIYSQSSVFVLPSLNEGMSNTMLEALATGLPIIATNTGGTKELVEDGVNGFIVKMEDSDDIAEKIKLLISNPELQKRMSLASRKKSESLSWESVAKKYYKLYQGAKEK